LRSAIQRAKALLLGSRYMRFTRRRFRNFSRNRPETTNLNHQNAIRRVFVFMVPSSVLEVAPTGIMDSA
jgi:hypothetical protein